MNTSSLTLVSVGPGARDQITPAAQAALAAADVIVSYDLYLTWIDDLIAGKEILTFPLTQERTRALAAIAAARAGKKVALVSSGDIGIYGMAPLVLEEIAEQEPFELVILPGVSAANASASLLGSPLAHDFATLSLSDLLCPWQWIEERAQAAARADMCLALYNVQSQKRPDGIYKILDIMLAHKSPHTICGIVRNAYRPEQSVKIATLQELRATKFDMFTCIIIGNRFTRRKGRFMFNPRGYNNWASDQGVDARVAALSPATKEPLPENAVWVFAGTADGNRLATTIARSGAPVVVSVASAYGAELAARIDNVSAVVSGRLGKERRAELLVQSKASTIVDATHPYAEAISEQLHVIANECGIPYVRFARPASLCAHEKGVHQCSTIEDAARLAARLGKRIFLSTGSRQIKQYLEATADLDCQWFARIAPDRDSLEEVLQSQIPRQNIIAMQGPFSVAMNKALWLDWQIDVVISKDSGVAGGLPEKIMAAQELGIPIVVLARPLQRMPVASSFAEVVNFVKQGSLKS